MASLPQRPLLPRLRLWWLLLLRQLPHQQLLPLRLHQLRAPPSLNCFVGLLESRRFALRLFFRQFGTALASLPLYPKSTSWY